MTTISVHEASIRTASVTIKALAVNGKQVTQSLFRQLQEEDIVHVNLQGSIQDTGLVLRGVPWGFINYHPNPECKNISPDGHRHIVWQLGEELRRDTVFEESDNDTPIPDYRYWVTKVRTYYTLRDIRDYGEATLTYLGWGRGTKVQSKHSAFVSHHDQIEQAVRYLRGDVEDRPSKLYYDGRSYDSVQDVQNSILKDHEPGHGYDEKTWQELHDEIAVTQADISIWIDRWAETRRVLWSLDQLFIAV